MMEIKFVRSRDSSIDVGLRAGWPDFHSRKGQENFLNSTATIPARGPTQPPIQLLRGSLSLRVKRPGRKSDHSPPSRAEVKNGGAINPLPHKS
jgi:hypothetical protein